MIDIISAEAIVLIIYLASGQQRALMLVHPHSKVVLSEAVRNDCNFLSKSNIMDYSYARFFIAVILIPHFSRRLLLGVDEERKQIICGLVDTIGAYCSHGMQKYLLKPSTVPFLPNRQLYFCQDSRI